MSDIAISTPTPINYGDRLILDFTLDGADAGCEANLSFHVTVDANPSTVTDQPGGGNVFDSTRRVSTGSAAHRTSFTLSGGSEWSAGGGDGKIELICNGNVIATKTFSVEP